MFSDLYDGRSHTGCPITACKARCCCRTGIQHNTGEFDSGEEWEEDQVKSANVQRLNEGIC